MQYPYIEIQGRKIGYNFEPLVIAEIGINHEGSLKTAKEMVLAAKAAGVEVVKHQTHIVEDEMSAASKNVIPGNAKESIYDIMARCALNEEDEFQLMKFVQDQGMIFISTPFGRAAANRLNEWGVPAFKIGSGECNNFPLLEHIADFGKPVILSTGMNTINSIRKAIDIFEKKNIPLAILHTTNLYPTPNHLVRLGAMQELHENFPRLVFGLSDHTITNHACFGAVALGASILERHFTYHMKRKGPDIACSMDQGACSELIEGCKILFLQRGGKKEPTKEEQVTIDFAFASICTIKTIKKGEIFTKDNLWVKRPGKGGIPAESFKQVLGKRASNNLEIDIQLRWDDIE